MGEGVVGEVGAMSTVSVVEVKALPPLRSIREWIAFAILKICAGLTLLHGLSMVVAIVPLFGFATENPGIESAIWAALWISTAFVLAGVFARYLGRTPKPLLANELLTVTDPPGLGPWALLLIATLILLPLTTFHELAPLKSLWVDMLEVLDENNVFAGVLDAPQFSGVILAPVAAALLVPMFEVVTAVAFAGSSFVLILLITARSSRFTRAYLMCLLLLASLVFASVYGADLAGDVAQWVAKEAGTTATHMRTTEVVRVLDAVQRYDRVLHTTGMSLLWTFAGYVLWLPILLRWRPAIEAFAVDTDGVQTGVPGAAFSGAAMAPGARGDATGASAGARANPEDVASLSPEARRSFYEQAARELQGSGSTAIPRNKLRFALLRALTQAGALHHAG
jgi:hypothetical protein